MQKKAGNLGLVILFIMSLMIIIALGTGLAMTIGAKNDLEKENKKLKEDVSTLENNIETMKTSINELNDVMKNLNSSLSNATSKVNSAVSNSNTTSNSNESTSTNSTKSDEEIVREAYSKRIETTANSSEDYKLKEYRIDEVEVYSEEKVKQLKKDFPYISEDGIFARVTYSVRPENMESSWQAGNGEGQGEWIINKSVFIIVQEKNGSYVIVSEGTSW